MKIADTELDIEAGTPEQAAKQALAILTEPGVPHGFQVRMVGPCPSCKAFVIHTTHCPIARKFGGTHAGIDYPYTVAVQG